MDSAEILTGVDKVKLQSIIDHLEFVENDANEKYKCVKCERIALYHYIAQCTHIYCNICHGELHEKQCVVNGCQHKINKITQDVSFEKEVAQLIVKCPYKDNGCTEEITLRKFFEHKRCCKLSTGNLLPKVYKKDKTTELAKLRKEFRTTTAEMHQKNALLEMQVKQLEEKLNERVTEKKLEEYKNRETSFISSIQMEQTILKETLKLRIKETDYKIKDEIEKNANIIQQICDAKIEEKCETFKQLNNQIAEVLALVVNKSELAKRENDDKIRKEIQENKSLIEKNYDAKIKEECTKSAEKHQKQIEEILASVANESQLAKKENDDKIKKEIHENNTMIERYYDAKIKEERTKSAEKLQKQIEEILASVANESQLAKKENDHKIRKEIDENNTMIERYYDAKIKEERTKSAEKLQKQIEEILASVANESQLAKKQNDDKIRKEIHENNTMIERYYDAKIKEECKKSAEKLQKQSEQTLASVANDSQLAKKENDDKIRKEIQEKQIEDKSELLSGNVTGLGSQPNVYWEKASRGPIQHKAVYVGLAGNLDKCYVGRAIFDDAVIPCNVVITLTGCYALIYLTWGKKLQEYQVLCTTDNAGVQWLPASNGQVPTGAIKGGILRTETCFIGRVEHQGIQVTGMVQPSQKNMTIRYYTEVISYTSYEVLCVKTFDL